MAKTKVDDPFLEGENEWVASEVQGRYKLGRPPKFTAETLNEAVAGYFRWKDAHPLKSEELGWHKGAASRANKSLKRIGTIAGLCVYLGIDESTWRAWRNPESDGYRADLSPITSRAEHALKADKLAGASAGLYNPNIVARLLGLSDKQEHTGSVVVKIGSDDSGL